MKVLVVLALFACATAFKLPPAYKQVPRHVEWNMEPRFTNEDKIVGGTTAGVTEFPFIISLRSSSWWSVSHRCGGTIISSTRIATAAHCTIGTSASSLNVAAGQYNKSSDSDDNEQIVNIADAVEHSSYNSQTLDNDFAVLKLAAALKFNNYVAAITMGSCKTDDMVTVAGWGTTTEGGSTPNTLLKLTVPVIDTVACNTVSAYNGKITGNMVCAGYLNKAGSDSCQGDSGGPLTLGTGKSAVLVGIVSWGEGCARVNKPGVYSRVVEAQSWISSV